jgi:regulator of sigma D
MNNEQINECADSIFYMVEEQIQDTIEFYIESKEIELEENKIFEYQDKVMKILIEQLKQQIS